ncbi:uncharacterized protein LOC126847908 isoform X2 [Adelges cooleyi]|uniref:uncharacterized protein LOC126847908 isoform X2 n=1 Tax=Adelges cooleyi TaxID=133065 RepID=UPI00218060CE|nr:uncharacterized protein LOC126847908 isoform X2 [Adelges cooleyi]
MVKLSHMFGAPALAMPLLVPSLIDERVANYEEILQELKDSQIKLQTEITNLLGLLNTVMRSLGWTRDSTESFYLYDSRVFVKLGQERKDLTRGAIKVYINLASRPAHEDYGDCNLMCRLKGVNRTILHPDSFVTLAEVVGDQCRLTDYHENTIVVNCIGDD